MNAIKIYRSPQDGAGNGTKKEFTAFSPLKSEKMINETAKKLQNAFMELLGSKCADASLLHEAKLLLRNIPYDHKDVEQFSILLRDNINVFARHPRFSACARDFLSETLFHLPGADVTLHIEGLSIPVFNIPEERSVRILVVE